MKKTFPFLLMLLVIVSCGKDDDGDGSNKLGTPLLLSPANNSSFTFSLFVSSFNVEWTEVQNATQYLIELSDNSSFSQVLFSETTPTNDGYISANIDGNYLETGTYF